VDCVIERQGSAFRRESGAEVSCDRKKMGDVPSHILAGMFEVGRFAL
jgi:hypothetical protein